MNDGLDELLETFEGVGFSRGSMNGRGLRLLTDPEGGFKTRSGTMQFLEGLRSYERRKGTARTYRDTMQRHINASAREGMARKKALRMT